ncbi:Clp protease N-terminal domain-containing protein [Streptomyces sp. NPDC102487]|uniref:Clp protease N-terminal domain-containing protein n=1 Tax=Streptomyces sp. NPDC102487 TaxID=3366182 RepID=UPI00380C0780
MGATCPRCRRRSDAAGRREGAPGHIAFRPESEEAIDEARRASADLGHGRVGTEHTLLGLIRTEDSPAARILRSIGFAPDELRATVEAEVAERSAAGDLH